MDGKPQDHRNLVQFEFVAARFRRVVRRLVVVAQQVLVAAVASAGSEGGGQQPLWQDHPGAQSQPVSPVLALPNPMEAVAGSYDPGVGRGPAQVLAEVLEYRGVIGRHGGEVVEGFVDAGRQVGRWPRSGPKCLD